MIAILRNDFLSLFRSPFGWSLMALSQILLGLAYFLLLNNYFQKLKYAIPTSGVSYEIIGLLVAMLVYLAILIIPLIALRSFAYERKHKSIELLFASPVSSFSIVLGKYLSMLAFITCLMVSIFIMVLTLAASAELDWGVILSTLLAGFLLLACYSSIALFFSTLIKQPLLAGLTASLVLFLFLMLDLLANTRIEWLDQGLNYLSIIRHFENLINGLIRTSDLFYFLIVITLFLSLSHMQVDKIRHSDI